MSEALEQLAILIADQKFIDNDLHIKQFSLIVNKFSETTARLKENDQPEHRIILKKKYNKGFLLDYLKKRNLYVGSSIASLKVDDKLYQISDFLASHYEELKDFYSGLKRHQNLKQNFKVQTTHNSIEHIRKWCTLLYQQKIIDSFRMMADGMIDVDIAEVHKATYFINGFWLEILLGREIAGFINNNADKIENFDILARVELIKSDKSNSELDLLLMINHNVYWFECKSGNIGDYYKKFSQHRELLGLNESNSFIVVPEMLMNQANAAFLNSGMSMLYSSDLEEQLQNIILK